MMHPEQAAFEANIDKDPFDSTNHAVYADWLDEHDQPDEAAFRRSMGEWIRGGHVTKSGSQYSVQPSALSTTRHMPEGVKSTDIAYYHPEFVGEDGQAHVIGHESGKSTRTIPEPHHAAWGLDHADRGVRYFTWNSYRGMEHGFRNAFMKNRKQQYRRRLTRIAAARGYVRQS
jgi:uncharacterized protein (TIGR02996 family)